MSRYSRLWIPGSLAPRAPRNDKSERHGPMAISDDDERPKKKLAHEIGQDLTLLSVEELAARVELLREEIARLESDMARKRATRAAADQFFKR